jgi:predicted nucleic acid-binding Zn ribbon protein
MALLTFQCTRCNERWTALTGVINDPAAKACPSCGEPVETAQTIPQPVADFVYTKDGK